MRVLAHVSDLHFGREDARLGDALVAELAALRPNLIVVSGDLTQRARTAQFEAAAAFLRRLPGPSLVVPGNHDIPLFDVVRRLLRPLERYRRFINPDLDPFWTDGALAVLGLNTARSLTWKEGRVSGRQIRELSARLEPLPASTVKIVVTHHPFIPPPQDPGARIVGRGREALKAAAASGVDLLLAGHLHLGYAADVRHHHVAVRRSMLAIQAGTAISTRVREHPNGYNVLRLEPARVELEVRSWNGGRFEAHERRTFEQVADEWR